MNVENGIHDPHYFVPQPSRWPITGSIALFCMTCGTAFWINNMQFGKWVLLLGFLILIRMLFGWFHDVIQESQHGDYGQQVDHSFRWGMSWFIFSEVMFFAAFFGALFYTRVISVPELGWFSDTHSLLWPQFNAAWPAVSGPKTGGYTPMEAFGIPAINTGLLLSSGVTVTWAHWGFLKNNRTQMALGLAFTVALGICFLFLQGFEYHHAYTQMNLTLASGAYGMTFFMLTGFHGMHVLVGVLMLSTMLGRVLKGHFTPAHHFGFEAAAWYWHFVDVVWLGLFVFVYCL
ncbi:MULTISPECIES: cytochrome c oxidase subunit 3 [Silvimonas]|uniref:cytochrome c oxidase subunit 3 n=1 Tax=Silvimonas TaxID=300264 RepID=UPI0024B3B2BB|nr:MULTISPECIES: cytochrome c oxidase subunit 3 [Silvimonas]MDR3429613.1 cytochrome c oxidase subunit 3 [Silvimonas sp.]